MFSFLSIILQGSRPATVRGWALVCTVLLALPGSATFLHAESETPIRIDASQPTGEPQPALYDEGSATSPSGDVLGVNSRYLTRNGKPWLPVMGEFHFSRYPRAEWEEEILKMKAAGVNIVASYVIWIHNEEIKGQFDWSGQRDLRAFAQLCAKHGMYFVARIGPWDHAEVRNGGLPDWVLKQGPTRVNDPVYLASVRAWYGQIGQQLNGLLWKDGGPVIGIQLENEYSRRGPGAGAAHILELKKIALASGLDVPLYLVTGWDNATVPPRAVIPVYGGYPAAPWDGSINKLPPAEVYAFRFSSRVAANLNAGGQGMAGAPPSPQNLVPYLTAEIGGGNEDTYHRRPVIQPDDIAAMFPVMLGSGVNLYGTYMFQGGENPEGKLSTLQESQRTGYPNDLPIKSYDFQAPLGEFGLERESFRKLKVFQYFLNDFGAELAPMTVHAPDVLPKSSTDLTAPRASVRSNGDSGFIFFNNYVRGYSMPARPAAQFLIRLPGHTLDVPRHPADLPSGAYFIWPFNLHIGGITLQYSTAQLFTRLESGGRTILYFEAIPGVPAEFAFDAAAVRSIRASSGTQTTSNGVLDLSGVEPGIDSSIDLVSNKGEAIRIVVLTAEQAENAWKVRINGNEHLLITAQDFFADPDGQLARIWLRSTAAPRFEFTLTPRLGAPADADFSSNLPLHRNGTSADAERFWAESAPRDVKLEWHPIRAAGDAPPVQLGPALDWRPHGVAEAPPETELPEAAQWAVTVPAGSMDGLSNVFLRIEYEGDVARLYAGHQLLDDDFYNGQPWTIGLKRFLDPRGAGSFTLSILPLRSDAPVYFELPDPLQFSPEGQVDRLKSIRALSEYQLVLGCGHAQPVRGADHAKPAGVAAKP